MINKQVKRRIFNKIDKFYKFELYRLVIRGIVSDLRFDGYIRFYFFIILNNLDINFTRINFVCIKTYKYRGFINFFNISRISFRENVSFAKYSGIKRAAW